MGAELRTQTDAPGRAPRKDAARNREALLAAAGEVFAERGVDASLEEIARRAGVGIGTLYRHFPTRDALNEAVYRREVEPLCDGADELLAEHDAGRRARGLDAPLRRLRRAQARHGDGAQVGARRRTTSCSATATSASTTRSARCSTPPRRPGAIRSDVDCDDLLRAMSGICMATDAPGGPSAPDAWSTCCWTAALRRAPPGDAGLTRRDQLRRKSPPWRRSRAVGQRARTGAHRCPSAGRARAAAPRSEVISATTPAHASPATSSSGSSGQPAEIFSDHSVIGSREHERGGELGRAWTADLRGPPGMSAR